MYIIQYLQKGMHWLFAPCLIPSNSLSLLVIFQAFVFPPLLCLQMWILLQVLNIKGVGIFRVFEERLSSQRCNICLALSGWCIWGNNALIRLCCRRERLPHFREIPAQEGNCSFRIHNLEYLTEKIIRPSLPSGMAVDLVVWAPCARFSLRGKILFFFFFFSQHSLIPAQVLKLSKVKLENNNVESSA